MLHIKKHIKTLLSSLALSFLICSIVISASSSKIARGYLGPEGAWHETSALKEKRLDWWRKGKFGMFIHWGLYAIPAGGKRFAGVAAGSFFDSAAEVGKDKVFRR